jgi:hypothetical protein
MAALPVLQVCQDNDQMEPDEWCSHFKEAPELTPLLDAVYDNGTSRAFQSDHLLNIASPAGETVTRALIMEREHSVRCQMLVNLLEKYQH